MSTEPTSDFWYCILWIHRICSVTEQRENLRNNDITMLMAVENFDPDSGSVDARDKSNRVLSCTEGSGTVTPSAHPQISHRCWTWQWLVRFRAWKTSSPSRDDVRSVWHQGADRRESPVSTCVQLWTWWSQLWNMCPSSFILVNCHTVCVKYSVHTVSSFWAARYSVNAIKYL